MKALFNILFIFSSFFSISQIDGEWHSSFEVMGTSHRMDLIIKNDSAKPTIIVINPDSKKSGNLNAQDVSIIDNKIVFKLPSLSLSYSGKYYSNGDSIQGSMTQFDVKWMLTFYREIQEKIIIQKPQEPKEPFAYPVEELLIKNGDIVLGATLTLPKNAGENYPIVVLASGSGPQNRNCEIMGHKPFLVIADYLARNGIGCLRFDDRGMGKSTGDFQKATLEDFASDLKACVAYLAKDPRFIKNPIGIAGHSEGGMHALIAAKKNRNVKFIIELASVGTSGREVLIDQQYVIPLKSGKSEFYAQWNRDLYSGMCDIISKYSAEKINEPLNAFLEKKYEEAPQEYKDLDNKMSFIMGMSMFLNNDWGRQFIHFEAKDYLKKIHVPILTINGSEDIQVSAVSNQKGFEASFSKRSKAKSKALILNGLNHLFQTCTTCTIIEYGEIQETFSEDALDTIRNWVKELNL